MVILRNLASGFWYSLWFNRIGKILSVSIREMMESAAGLGSIPKELELINSKSKSGIGVELELKDFE